MCATGFDRVWETYPHHQRRSRKTEARERWSAYKLEPLTENVLAHLEADRNTRDWQRDDGSFVPGMQVWLRRRRLDFRSPPEQPQQAEDWEDKFVRGEP